MAEITKVIPEYTGTTPNKKNQTPTEFMENSDDMQDFIVDFPGHVNDFSTQANSLRSEVNTSRDDAQTAQTAAETAQSAAETAQTEAEAARDTAAITANAAEWDAGRTYAKYEQVYDPTTLTLLTSKADNNLGNDPVLTLGTWWKKTLDWQTGSESTSGASDIVLTGVSLQTQKITFMEEGHKVTLPDASDLSPGHAVFAIVNAGAFRFFIEDCGGNIVVLPVDPGKGVIVTLIDNGTSAGTWSFFEVSEHEGRFCSSPAEVYASGVIGYSAGAALVDTDKVLLAYYYGSAVYGRVITIGSNFEISVGAATQIHADSPSSHSITCSKADTNEAVVCWTNADSSNHGAAIHVTVSGESLSMGAVHYFETGGAATDIKAAAVDTDAVFVQYVMSGALYMKRLSVSGTTVSSGSRSTVDSTMSSEYHDIVAVNTEYAHSVWIDSGSSNNLKACVIRNTGSIEIGGVQTIKSQNCGYVGIAALAATTHNRSIVCFKSNTEPYGQVTILYSNFGSTSLGYRNSEQVGGSLDNHQYFRAAKLNDDEAMIFYRDGNNDNVLMQSRITADENRIKTIGDVEAAIVGGFAVGAQQNEHNSYINVGANRIFYTYPANDISDFGTMRVGMSI